jgi:FtsP/CotA-like multicopper oxidase with cupredoxin domain
MQYIIGSPDGVQKRIIGFNGQFPGPTLTCTNGKTMIVRVTNDMADDDEPTSIHWHGIQQTLSPFYDGPQSITQCPIVRQTSMIYKFQLFQSGTYW